MKSLILILLCPTLVFGQYAVDVPEGYEIVSQTEDRIEVKDLLTGWVTPYYIGDLPDTSISEWPLDIQDNGVHEWYYFERVAELPWYAQIKSGDTNMDGLGEVYASGPWFNRDLFRHDFLYPWEFFDYDHPIQGTPYDIGDPDNDGLTDVLMVSDTGLVLMEARIHEGYPDTIVWAFPWNIYFEIVPKLGDLDGDGLGEVLFYDGSRTGYQIFENVGDNQYEYKTKIPFRDYVGDWTGEPSWGDIDGDGLNEVFAGGIHGEIIMFECVADDSFEFVWQGYAGGPNAYSTEFLGDTDGDGSNEFMIGCWGGGFMNTLWETDGDNSYQLKYTTVLGGRIWGDADIELGDYFGDNAQNIAICGNDFMTILKPFGNDWWAEVLRFYTNTGSSFIRHFSPDTVLNDVIINSAKVMPSWTTWVYNIRGAFIPADANNDGLLMGSDVTYLIAYFKGHNPGIAEPFIRADANGDCEISGADVTFLVRYFKGIGDAPEPGWCHFFIEE